MTTRRHAFEILEDRQLLAADFGDAPDLSAGTGHGNYRTLLTDDGPRHTIVAGLKMGTNIDGEDGGVLQNAAANADDVNGALPDDEDGLANPTADLTLTIGAQPRVNVRVTNTTGTAATLWGWIDYNADGVFDNATERASTAVQSGTNNGIVTLVFPTVPTGYTGTSYARFRLSTDPASANSTGPAADGEVEDYQATILAATSGLVNVSKSQTIDSNLGGGPTLANDSTFATAIAAIGDLDGDGIPDLAVGSPADVTGGTQRGAVVIQFMNSDGTVRANQEIADNTGGGPALADFSRFGSSIAAIGDLNGDGVSDLAVGAPETNSIYVLFMNTNGTARYTQRISSGVGGGPTMDYNFFGSAIASIGDIDGDGVSDLAVGAEADDGGLFSNFTGAIYVLMMRSDGTVKSSQKIDSKDGGGPFLFSSAEFGGSITSLGDLNGDGFTDIAVGAAGFTLSDSYYGTVYVLFLNSDGTVISSQTISGAINGISVKPGDFFGSSVASQGDLDGDGVTDLVVGVDRDDTGGGPNSRDGAVDVLFMNPDGTVKAAKNVAYGSAEPDSAFMFGASVALIGDLDGDGITELAVGGQTGYAYGIDHGRETVLFLQQRNYFSPQVTSSVTVGVPENTTAVVNVTATDADLPSQTITYSIVGGADRGFFQISMSGALSFVWPRDFEVPQDVDRDNVYVVVVEADDGDGGTTTQTISVSVTDVADPPSLDFGDAPDSGPGTGRNNYNTLSSDNGARHTIVPGLRIGTYVDGDSGDSQNATANADDVNGALPDDEDGLSDPAADLTLTVGAQPRVSVRVTNTTGTAATLWGWIDYDADGVFDNATERASVVVPSGTNNGLVALVFPKVTRGYTGTTYARFRLSSDPAAANSIGAAADGEVEDYQAAITTSGTGHADQTKNTRIGNNLNGGPALVAGGWFGSAVAAIGDLNGDGVNDLAVGASAIYSDEGNSDAVYILFMNRDGTAEHSQKIGQGIGGGPSLESGGYFGGAVTALGDLDGDGVPDIAVGDVDDNSGGSNDSGAVYVLFLNSNGTVKNSQKIANGIGGGPTLGHGSNFGSSVAGIGDLNGDGIVDLAVGAYRDGTGEAESGAVYILFLNSNGTVKSSQKIASNTGGAPIFPIYFEFGHGVASLGDVDGDGITDIAVGATGLNGEDYHGAVAVLFLNPDGTVKNGQLITTGLGGAPPLSDYDNFGGAIVSLGDLDGDGVTDIAVGASGDDTGNAFKSRGAVYVLYLNVDGTVKNYSKIASNKNGGPALDDFSGFGSGLAALGDLDGDGVIDLAVGAHGGSEYGIGDPYGSVYIIHLTPVAPDFGDAPDTGPGTGRGNYQTTESDNGPSHGIVDGLRLGARVDSDDGTLEDVAASADNMDGELPGDDDGLLSSTGSLAFTVGDRPAASMRATNTTGADAMLYGWIDFNEDGVFDNADERESIVVPQGTVDGIFTLYFPSIEPDFVGKTYARFRLSSDPAAANSTGPAADGEVEDYRVEIDARSTGTPDPARTVKIGNGVGGGPDLQWYSQFGRSMVAIGDVDGDGVTDLAVGAENGSSRFFDSGTINVVLMNRDGTAKSVQKVGSHNTYLGAAVAALGDLDGDGVPDIAVSAPYVGAIKVIFLNADGSQKRWQFIDDDHYVEALAGVGDLDGDGVPDLAVGTFGISSDGQYHGAVQILFLKPDGTIKAANEIGSGIGGGPSLSTDDQFGNAIAAVGDVDGDGVPDIAVSDVRDGPLLEDGRFSSYRGAVYVLFMQPNGTVKGYQKIADGIGGGPILADYDSFGLSLATLGDLDGDGISELAVGAPGYSLGDKSAAVYVLHLNQDGTARILHKITDHDVGIPADTFVHFGFSLAGLGDLDGDGIPDLASGVFADYGSGAVFVMFFKPLTKLPGDYNSDGVVDAADYTVWRGTLGSTTDLRANGDDTGASAGVVDQADFELWKARFGDTVYADWDFGDAPDSNAGTGRGNYSTLLADDGPRHKIVAGLSIGTTVDAELGTLENSAANADDIAGGLPDDEDGLANPAADLALTIGTEPQINVYVTNTTDNTATLWGWIDYNADGVFDNDSERASIVVPSGTDNGIVTLVFPKVPVGYTGTTYSRFRLSTDPAAANSFGAANDGEVEDYQATIMARGIGHADAAKTKTITDYSGHAIAALGDLDGDGVPDVAVGDPTDEDDAGAVVVLFMNNDGTVKSAQRIATGVGGGPRLDGIDNFGSAVASVGDLDGDGVTDIAVGARYDTTWGVETGTVYILFLNRDGTAKSYSTITSENGGPYLQKWDAFGSALASPGDIDGDGIPDLVVGAPGDDTQEFNTGAVYVLFMRTDGTVKSSQKIASDTGGGPTLVEDDAFGTSLTALGDINGDGIGDLAAGSYNDNGPYSYDEYRGAVHILLMNGDGTVKQIQKIGNGIGGGPGLSTYDNFGISLAAIGDLDGDGVNDLAVGATGSGGGYSYDGGAVYVMLLNADGSAKTTWRIGNSTNGGPLLDPYSGFGSAVASLGDLDGDGVDDLMVGAPGGYDETHKVDVQPELYVLHLRPVSSDYGDAPDTGLGTGHGNYQTTASDNGPSHGIVDGLRLGARVDGDDGTLQNTAANADTIDGIQPADEDGAVDPADDFTLTVGATPAIRLWVTNTIGKAATLYGWIDYNGDGVFDNATERGDPLEIPDGTGNDEVAIITFPKVPPGYAGTTYARFRLSTDPAAANSFGPAVDGEVEDYQVHIFAPSSGLPDSTTTAKTVTSAIKYGASIASVGDINGDGTNDLLARGGTLLLMSADGTVKTEHEIEGLDYVRYGGSAASLGDLDGDGVSDIALADGDFLTLAFLNADGNVKRTEFVGRLGHEIDSIAPIGDLDGDGVTDLAIGSADDETNDYAGSVLILLMNADGTAKAVSQIGNGIGGGPPVAAGDHFGSSVTALGDVDGDGITDVAVGALYDDPSAGVNQEENRGAIYVVFLNNDGEAKGYQKIGDGVGGGPALTDDAYFGNAVASLGDLDGDGITDLAVGALYEGGGAVYILHLSANGTAKQSQKIASGLNGGPVLQNGEQYGFGAAIASLGDLNRDGLVDFAVTSRGDDEWNQFQDALFVIFTRPEEADLAGDYNGDGAVDAADYVVWRHTLGSTDMGANGDNTGSSAGVIDQADYDVWKNHFGETPSPGVASGGAPDSSTADLLIPALLPSVAVDDSIAALQLTTSSPSHIALASTKTIAPIVFGSEVTDQNRLPVVLTGTLTDASITAVRQDSALLAWFASHNDAKLRDNDSELHDFVDVPSVRHPTVDGLNNSLFEVVDDAFEALLMMPAIGSRFSV